MLEKEEKKERKREWGRGKVGICERTQTQADRTLRIKSWLPEEQSLNGQILPPLLINFMFGEQLNNCSPLGCALKSSQELLSNLWVWDARPTSLACWGWALPVLPWLRSPACPSAPRPSPAGLPPPTVARCLQGSPEAKACQRTEKTAEMGQKGSGVGRGGGGLRLWPFPAQNWPRLFCCGWGFLFR